MNEGQNQQKNLIDTTDCLEAVGVFRAWKNFLFVIIICLVLLLQASFWLVDLGYVKSAESRAESSVAAAEGPEQIKQAAEQSTEVKTDIEKAAQQVAAGPNQPARAEQKQPKSKKTIPVFYITAKKLTSLVRFFDFVLIPAAILYCLTLLFGLKISLLARLGGINHISRAFFLSLAFVVLLLPWQRLFAGVVAGAMYTPRELLRWYTIGKAGGIFGTIFYYLRFTGYWLVVLLLLIFSQLRSSRWAKAILRRLEVV